MLIENMKVCGAPLFLTALLALGACADTGGYKIDMMPSPEVYEEGSVDPFIGAVPIGELPYDGMLYATDRKPAADGARQHYYLNERGNVLRLGVAQVELARPDVTWKDARQISILKNRSDKYPIRISDISEFGVLDRTATEFMSPELLLEASRPANEVFAEKVNAKLARSRNKDIYIYVHGYKAVFENPTLVATELWHFLGYKGVFIAYAWPSTPSPWAYLRDIDTAAGSARHLRIFLQYLAEETDAERIHLIGYSMGTRLVTRAIGQLALMYHEHTSEEIQQKLRIGQVILAGSDLDRGVAVKYLADGFLEVPQHVVIYVSSEDRALGMSRFLTRRKRLGQMWAEGALNPRVADYLHEREADLSVIYVSGAEGTSSGNGHAYFRDSPWVSSDVLMSLAYDLPPDERGLVRVEEDSPIWSFPPDYIERLRVALIKANPEYGTALKQMSDQR
jgi:esterase/lipase superfamily enzyme